MAREFVRLKKPVRCPICKKFLSEVELIPTICCDGYDFRCPRCRCILPCYFLLNYARGNNSLLIYYKGGKILLFSFELCHVLPPFLQLLQRCRVVLLFSFELCMANPIDERTLSLKLSLLFSFELCIA